MLIAGHRMSGTGLGTAQFAFGHGTEQEAVATVHAALDAGLRTLGTDRIDLYLLHHADRPPPLARGGGDSAAVPLCSLVALTQHVGLSLAAASGRPVSFAVALS